MGAGRFCDFLDSRTDALYFIVLCTLYFSQWVKNLLAILIMPTACPNICTY